MSTSAPSPAAVLRVPRPGLDPDSAAALAVGREDLDPRRQECVVCYVDRLLRRGDCSGDLDLAAWWGGLRAPRATTLVPRLRALGATCDCEVLTRLYVSVPALERRTAAPWDAPVCKGVPTGSAQPCRAWLRRPRWA